MGSFFEQVNSLSGEFATNLFGAENLSDIAALGPAEVVGGFLKVILGFLGVIFTVLVIWGAVKWMTSRGEEEVIKQARDLITNATIGLTLAIAGYALTVLIIDVILKTVIGPGAGLY